MNIKKFWIAALAIVVLIVGVYLLAGNRAVKIIEKQVGGETNFDRLCLGHDGLISSDAGTSGGWCAGRVRLTLLGTVATGTAAWQNLTGGTVYIPSESAYVDYSNTASSSETIVVGTSTSASLGGRDQINKVAGTIFDFDVATATMPMLSGDATTSPHLGGSIALRNMTAVAAREWVVFTRRGLFDCNAGGAGGGSTNVSCVFGTSTQKGPDVNFRFQYIY